MQGIGILTLLATIVAGYGTGDWSEALITGVPLGAAILVGSSLGGGPSPASTGGEDWEESMALLRRVTVATTLVGAALTGGAAGLWYLDASKPIPDLAVSGVDVLVVAALSLLIVYGAIVAAGTIVLVSHVTGRDEA
jgi:hypothetical protein